jgi:CheY-like chemotaxis protein
MKILTHLPIRQKLYLISIISALGLIATGLAANYLFNSTRVISFILRGQRVHNVSYHAAISHYYKYMVDNDTAEIRQAQVYLNRAESLARAFGSIDQKANALSDSEFKAYILENFGFAYNNKISDNNLLASRLKLFLTFEGESFVNGIRMAEKTYVIGKAFRKDMETYVKSPSPELRARIDDQVNQIEQEEEKFASTMNAINDNAHNLLVVASVIIVILMLVLTTLATLLIASTISKPIDDLVRQFKKLSTGEIADNIINTRRDEIGTLTSEINNTLEVLRNITHQAQTIANGDYSTRLTPRSEKDTMSIALNQMTEALKESAIAKTQENWHKNGIAAINDLVRGDKKMELISEKSLSYLTQYLEARMGMIYLMEGNNTLRLISTYAYHDRTGNFSTIKVGEGLIGQAAKEGSLIEFSGIKENAPMYNSGLYEEIPNFLLALPMKFNNEVNGVIVLASMEKFSKEKREFIIQASEIISVAISSAITRLKIETLLSQTQDQAEKLQMQQEELRQSNEELEEQTRALKASEETLQTQQEELRVTNEELEERSKALEKERDTIKQKNDELSLMQDEISKKASALEIASKYKSEFLANMSHELRTPLNSILVLSQLLTENKTQNLNEKQIEFAKTINSSGSDLLALINDILDLSKVESGKVDVMHDQIGTSDFLGQMETVFLPLARQKSIDLITEAYADAPAYFTSDQKRLGQIIKNLLSNAIKFTSKGEVRLTIKSAPSNIRFQNAALKPGQVLAIEVKDTGIGIPTEKHNLIFEAFQQVDGTTSRKYGGTGLGLTISRSFAALLQGEIHLESREGVGSTFTLFIPKTIEESFGDDVLSNVSDLSHDTEKSLSNRVRVSEKSKKSESFTTASSAANAEDLSENGGPLLLIIEDDLQFAKVVCSLAKEKGFRCLHAPDGETGLHYADFHHPDAIILDVGLPGIDGIEVLKQLKQNPDTRLIPVHIMTARDETLDSLKMGAIGILTKPVDPQKLEGAFLKIEDMISRKVKKLLIVEDDEGMRKSIKELVGSTDIDIETVDEGSRAFELISQELFDCIILDLGLKGMSGFELLEKIRHNENARHIPVIIYTGKDLSRAEEERLQRFADSIIIKGAKSPDRLLAETTLFLHKMQKSLKMSSEDNLLTDKDEVLKDKKILIVDDDMRNVFALSSVLEEKGLLITVARNGKEGISKLNANHDIQLVLMDIMMPEMDGYEAMREIRKRPIWARLPIIALTAKAMKEDREKCIEAGANDYLTKPVDTSRLLSLLRVWLYNSPQKG